MRRGHDFMAVLKNSLKENFTQIPNHIIVSNLSNEAFRLLVYLYSKPDDWKIYQGSIRKEFGVSRQSVNKWFKELKAKGFISIKQRTLQGKFDYVYRLMDGTVSSIVDTVTVSSLTDTESNGHGSNLTHTNTNSTNTDITNTKRDILTIRVQEVKNIFTEYVAMLPEHEQELLQQEEQFIINRIVFNLDDDVKSIKRYVTTCIDNELRKRYAIAELNHHTSGNYDKTKQHEFSAEDKQLAVIDWGEVLNGEEESEGVA